MTLVDLLAQLKKHLLLVIILPILSGLVVFAVAWFLPNEYTASTTMYVLSRDDAEEAATVTTQDLNVGQMLTSDVSTLMKSDRVKKDVAEMVGLPNLKGYNFNITSSTTTRVITLAVTGKDPEMTAEVANATVKEVSTVASEVMQIQSVNVIDTASVPTSPSGPRRLLYTAVGAFGGLFLAVAIVMLRDMLDTRVRNGAEAEEIVNVPVVGHFPAMDA